MSAIQQILKFLIPKSVGVLAGIVAALILVICQAVIVLPVIYKARDAAFDEVRARAVDHWHATLDARTQNRADENERVGKRLVVIGAIVGATIYDGSGAMLTSFGETPYASLDGMMRDQVTSVTSASGVRTDFYLSPDATGTPFQVIIRTDTSIVADKFQLNMRFGLGVILLGAFCSGLATALFLRFRVGRITRQMALAMEEVTADPLNAQKFQVHIPGRDEIAHLGHALDHFFDHLSRVWLSQVEVAGRMLEETPMAMLQILQNGEISQRNPAADNLLLNILSFEDVPSARKINVRNLLTDERQTLAEFAEAESGRCAYLEIETGDTPQYVVAAPLPIGQDEKTRFCAMMLADMSPIQLARLASDDLAAKQKDYIEMMHRREVEMKMTLDACMSLIQQGEKVVEAHVDPLPSAVEWCEEMSAVGIIRDFSMPSDVPSVSGSRALIRSIFRNSMMLGYAMIGKWPVEMKMEGRGVNFETVGFTITMRQSADAQDVDGKSNLLDRSLPLAALRADVKRAKGTLADVVNKEGEVTIRFVLRGVAEWLQAGPSR